MWKWDNRCVAAGANSNVRSKCGLPRVYKRRQCYTENVWLNFFWTALYKTNIYWRKCWIELFAISVCVCEENKPGHNWTGAAVSMAVLIPIICHHTAFTYFLIFHNRHTKMLWRKMLSTVKRMCLVLPKASHTSIRIDRGWQLCLLAQGLS